jgi:tripartite-type tricarboxylate transporter receptor subunit TctC
MLNRRRLLAASATGLFAAGSGLIPRVLAQTVKKPVHVIVGFPAGGGTDVTARVLAEALRGSYASAVLVENKPGASARIAVEYVKNADPDGSVMLFTPDFPMTLYPHSFKSLSYDPLKDFTPIAPATTSMLSFNVGPAVPANIKTLTDYVQWCKANPDKANYGTTSAGATPHFAGVMLSNESKVPMTPVHYKGGAPALQDVVGGHIPMSVNPLSEALPLHQTGTVRALAVTGAKRSQFMQDVPTAKEAGYDVVVESWLGVFLPPKAPADVVNALSAAMKNASQSAAMKDSLAKFASASTFQTPEQFVQTIKDDLKRWGPVVKASGFVAVD